MKAEHAWEIVEFSFGRWLQCCCGYRAMSDDQRRAHQVAVELERTVCGGGASDGAA